jgi:hypothetical protein
MAIKAIIDKLEDVPEALREHYRAGTKDEGTEGKFVLGVEAVAGWSLEDVTGLKSALGKERTQRETLERTVVKFKDIDPEKALAALTELEELKKLDPSKEADKIANTKFEAAKAQLLENHKREIGERDGKLTKLTGLVDNLARRQEAIAAIAAEKGSVDLLLPHVLSVTRSEIGDDAEAVRIKVLQPDGNERVNGKGEAMSIRELVAEMKQNETFARAFDGEGHSGTGKEHDKGGGGGPIKGDIGGSREERRQYFASKLKLPT